MENLPSLKVVEVVLVQWNLVDNQYQQKYEEAQNSRVTKSNYETELIKMTSHFELITQKCL